MVTNQPTPGAPERAGDDDPHAIAGDARGAIYRGDVGSYSCVAERHVDKARALALNNAKLAVAYGR